MVEVLWNNSNNLWEVKTPYIRNGKEKFETQYLSSLDLVNPFFVIKAGSSFYSGRLRGTLSSFTGQRGRKFYFRPRLGIFEFEDNNEEVLELPERISLSVIDDSFCAIIPF